MGAYAATVEELRKALSALLAQNLELAAAIWPKIAVRYDSLTLKEIHGWASDSPGVREWLGDAEINQLMEASYELVNKTWEETIAIKRTDFEDERLGIYIPRIQQMSEDIVAHRDELVIQALKDGFDHVGPDGKFFFAGDHDNNGTPVSNTGGGSDNNGWFILDCSRDRIRPLVMQIREEPKLLSKDRPDDDNVILGADGGQYVYQVNARHVAGYGYWKLAYGSKAAPTADLLAAGAQVLAGMKRENGKPINAHATHIVCSTTKFLTIKKLITAPQYVADGLLVDNPAFGLIPVENLIQTGYLD